MSIRQPFNKKLVNLIQGQRITCQNTRYNANENITTSKTDCDELSEITIDFIDKNIQKQIPIIHHYTNGKDLKIEIFIKTFRFVLVDKNYNNGDNPVGSNGIFLESIFSGEIQ